MYGPPKKPIDFPIVGRLQVGRRRGGCSTGPAQFWPFPPVC